MLSKAKCPYCGVSLVVHVQEDCDKVQVQLREAVRVRLRVRTSKPRPSVRLTGMSSA
jgi:hypothetical protein